MGGTALRNNRMFRKLCGEDAFKNVVLVTTFWEGIDPSVGEQREKELCENRDFWGGMLEKGARIVRLQTDRRSGLELIEQISASEKITLDAQDEMVNQGKDAKDTEALKWERESLERAQRELEAERDAARIKIELELEQARREQEEIVREERERVRLQREKQRIDEEVRQARERREAEVLYERQLEQIRIERVRQEENRRRETLQIERKKREERERQKEREEAAAEEVVRRMAEYQDNYVCIGLRPRWVCDKCKGKVERYTKYYRKCTIYWLVGEMYTDDRPRLLLLRLGQIPPPRGMW